MRARLLNAVTLVPLGVMVFLFLLVSSAIVGHWTRPGEYPAAGYLKPLTLGLLAAELGALLLAMALFFQEEVFATPADRAKRLFDYLHANESEHLARLLDEAHSLGDAAPIGEIANFLLRPSVVFREARALITRIVLLELRAFAAFVIAMMLLQMAAWLAASSPVFCNHSHHLDGPVALLKLLDHSVYFNAVTFATLGYGDITPNEFAGRLLVEGEVVTSLVFLVFGVNVFVALLLDCTSAAWQRREQYVRECVKGALNNRAAVAARIPTGGLQ